MDVLKAKISGDSSSLQSSVHQALASLSELKEAAHGIGEKFAIFGEVASGFGIALGAFAGLREGVEQLNQVFETGKHLRAEARTTGEDIINLVAIQRVYHEMGADAESAARHMYLLDSALGGVNEQGEPTKKVFEQMGLSMEWLKTLDYPERLKAISAAMKNFSHDQQASFVRGMVGKGGMDFLNILSNPEAIDEAQKETRPRGEFQQAHSKYFEEFSNSTEKANESIHDLFLGMAPGIADAFKPLMDQISKLKLIDVGQAIIRGLDPFIKGISAICIVLVNTFQDIYNVSALIVDLCKGIIGSIITTVALIGQNLSTIVSSVGSALKQGFLGAVETLGGGMISALAKPIAFLKAGLAWAFDQAVAGLSNIPGLNKLLGVQGYKAKSFDEHLKEDDGSSLAKRGEELSASGQKHFASMTDSLMPLAGIGKGIQAAYADHNATTAGDFDKDIDALAEGTKNMSDALTKLFSYQNSDESKKEGGSETPGGSAKGIDMKTAPDSDRLAKIGGFIAGGGASMDHARRTADATDTMKQILLNMASGGIRLLQAAGMETGVDAFAHGS
jgi:hypothetical protein